MSDKLLYSTVQVNMKALRAKWSGKAGSSAKGKGVGSAVELLHQGVQKLGELALNWRVQKELKKLEPDIERVMPIKGGVLVRIVTTEWKHPDPTGAKAKGFLEVGIAVTDRTVQAAVQKWHRIPRLLQGAPKGWVSMTKFVWVTRKAK